jgi:uncharacterized membrane protein (DUF2068 family)
MVQQRPTGITILAILAFIGGLLGIIGGFGGFALGGGYVVLGAISLIFGIVALALGYGFWTLKPWAWPLGIGLEIASLVLDVIYIVRGASVASEAISIIVSVIVLYYLTRPNVRQAFGR